MPRKPPPECPTELQDFFDEINQLPRTSVEVWNEFAKALKKIWDPLEDKDRLLRREGWSHSVIAAEYGECRDAVDFETALQEEFRDQVEAVFTGGVLPEFKEFALGFVDYLGPLSPGWRGVRVDIQQAQSSLAELRDLIYRADRGETFEWVSRTIHFVSIADDGVCDVESHDVVDVVSYIIENRVPIDRIGICCICDHAFWREYGGKHRKPATCGQETCYIRLGNLKKKSRRENGDL